MTPIRTAPVAEHELYRAVAKLNRERAGTGDRLLWAYRHALEQVERFPRSCPPVEAEVGGREFRNAILSRYDYLVVYEVLPAEVVVLAVVHAHRRPDAWHDSRLDSDTRE